DKPVGGGFCRPRGGRPATRAGRSARRSGDGTAWRPLATQAALRRADLDLQLEPPLPERGLEVLDQADEHLVGILLVLDERVLLAPGPVVDALAQLVEIVEVVLPLLIDHTEGDLRQRLLGEARDADPGLD